MICDKIRLLLLQLFVLYRTCTVLFPYRIGCPCPYPHGKNTTDGTGKLSRSHTLKQLILLLKYG